MLMVDCHVRFFSTIPLNPSVNHVIKVSSISCEKSFSVTCVGQRTNTNFECDSNKKTER